MDFKAGYKKLKERSSDLRKMCRSGSPFVFLCASAYIEYLSKLAKGRDRGSKGYKHFVTNWMAKVRPGYKNFKYGDGNTDLPVQMYHVLRCGIVHSFSLVPDKVSRNKGGRDRSIYLLHQKESKKRSISHLSNYSADGVRDAAAFVAEDFVNDIDKTLDLLFSTAKSNKQTRLKISSWLKHHPLITGDF